MPAPLAVAATFSRADAQANGTVLGRDARGDRGGVGRDHAQRTAGAQQARAALDRAHGVVQVLDHVCEHDHVEAVPAVELLERHLAHVEAERLACVQRRRARELQADDLEAASALLVLALVLNVGNLAFAFVASVLAGRRRGG